MHRSVTHAAVKAIEALNALRATAESKGVKGDELRALLADAVTFHSGKREPANNQNAMWRLHDAMLSMPSKQAAPQKRVSRR